MMSIKLLMDIRISGFITSTILDAAVCETMCWLYWSIKKAFSARFETDVV